MVADQEKEEEFNGGFVNYGKANRSKMQDLSQIGHEIDAER